MSSFADLRKVGPKVYGVCTFDGCGEKSQGVVQVRLFERHDGKQVAISSAAKTFCEQHAVEIFEKCIAPLPGVGA